MRNIGIEFVERVETFQLAGESDATFARRLGISITTLRDWRLQRDAGRVFEPKMATVQIVAECLGVNFTWLLLGEGEKVPVVEKPADEPESNCHETATSVA